MTNNLMDMHVRYMGLTVKEYRTLVRAGVKTIGDLTNYTETELLHLRNIGKVTVSHIIDRLTVYGFSLRNSK